MRITEVIRPGVGGSVALGLSPTVGGRVEGAVVVEFSVVAPPLAFPTSPDAVTVAGGFCAGLAAVTIWLNAVSSGNCTLDISTANCYQTFLVAITRDSARGS